MEEWRNGKMEEWKGIISLLSPAFDILDDLAKKRLL